MSAAPGIVNGPAICASSRNNWIISLVDLAMGMTTSASILCFSNRPSLANPSDRGKYPRCLPLHKIRPIGPIGVHVRAARGVRFADKLVRHVMGVRGERIHGRHRVKLSADFFVQPRVQAPIGGVRFPGQSVRRC